MYYVYILESTIAKKSYVGITDNIERRLSEHNQGNSTFTKRYKPWKIKYFIEVSDRQDARDKEKYFKSASGRRFLKVNIFKN